MTAATTTPPDLSAASPLRVTQARVVQSEWTKFRSLRSTVITLAVAIVITIVISLVFALVMGSNYATMSPADKHTFNAASTSLNGDLFAQLAFGVLGVLVMTGEYSTGMIRATLTAVPRRLPVLWAKITVFTLCVGIVALISIVWIIPTTRILPPLACAAEATRRSPFAIFALPSEFQRRMAPWNSRCSNTSSAKT